MKKILSIFLIVTIFLTLYACSNDNSNKDNHTSQIPDISIEEEITPPDISIEEEITPTVIALTKHNYNSYLNISITQTAQSPTLTSNTYLVTYNNGYQCEYTGLTPPKGTQCVLLHGNYSLLTTFTVKCLSKDKKYIFSNSMFTISYRSAPNQVSDFTVYISEDGNGSEVFMISEKYMLPNKIYSFHINDMIKDFNGKVSFFNNN